MSNEIWNSGKASYEGDAFYPSIAVALSRPFWPDSPNQLVKPWIQLDVGIDDTFKNLASFVSFCFHGDDRLGHWSSSHTTDTDSVIIIAISKPLLHGRDVAALNKRAAPSP